MTDRKQQPAQLKRRIALLEGQLSAEKDFSKKVFEGYREALYELVELRLRLKEAENALRGEE